MESVREPKSADKSTYSAEDIVVHDYGETVVVAFRLEAQIEKDGTMQPAHFRDTGTFLRRNGRWQVVAWQATKVAGLRPPRTEVAAGPTAAVLAHGRYILGAQNR